MMCFWLPLFHADESFLQKAKQLNSPSKAHNFTHATMKKRIKCDKQTDKLDVTIIYTSNYIILYNGYWILYTGCSNVNLFPLLATHDRILVASGSLRPVRKGSSRNLTVAGSWGVNRNSDMASFDDTWWWC